MLLRTDILQKLKQSFGAPEFRFQYTHKAECFRTDESCLFSEIKFNSVTGIR